MNNHRNHTIYIETGPFKYGQTQHEGRMMCHQCNTFIKWASCDEVMQYEQYIMQQQCKPIYGDEEPLTYDNFYHDSSDWVNADDRRIMKEGWEKAEKQERDNPTYTIWLMVDFKTKDRAKKAGAKWNHHAKCWYTTISDDRALDLVDYMAEDDLLRLAKHYNLV
jgi:hypothetical protein